jgi:hypothetical protein
MKVIKKWLRRYMYRSLFDRLEVMTKNLPILP